MPMLRWWLRIPLSGALFLGILVSGTTQAAVVTAIDHLIITRSGSPTGFGTYEGGDVYYRDSFDNGTPPPSGTFFASLPPAFPPPAAAFYSVFGSYGPSDECCVPSPPSKLRLDSSLGDLAANASGAGRQVQRATLLSNNVSSNSVLGLKPQFHTFSIFGLFDLVLPPLPVDGYGITFNDSPTAAESVELLVQRQGNNAVVVRFGHQDFVGGLITIVDDDLLTAPSSADQIELRLDWVNLDSDPEGEAMFASYRFWQAGVPLGAFQPMDGSAPFLNQKGYGRASFFAVQAVPEPGTTALLLVALSLLVVTAGRRRVS